VSTVLLRRGDTDWPQTLPQQLIGLSLPLTDWIWALFLKKLPHLVTGVEIHEQGAQSIDGTLSFDVWVPDLVIPI
jgi:hypothetical protein